MKVLICVLVIAAIVDIYCYKIPNLWIGIGMVMGLVFMVKEDGVSDCVQALIHILMVFMVFYPFYLLRGLGAGDVKLFMMLGCYIKGTTYLYCLLITMLLAGAWALIKIALYRDSRKRLSYLGQYCKKLVLTGILEDYEVDRSNKKSVIRLSIPVLCSVLLLYGGFYS